MGTPKKGNPNFGKAPFFIAYQDVFLTPSDNAPWALGDSNTYVIPALRHVHSQEQNANMCASIGYSS